MPLFSILLLLLTGALAGIAAGFLGIGGGAVLTPLCLLIFPTIGVGGDNIVRVIFGTNMFLVMVFSVSAVLKHHGNSKIDWRMVSIMAPLAIVGSLTGAWTASIVDSLYLKKGFAMLLAVSSVMLVLRGSTKPSGASSPGHALLPQQLIPLLGFVTGFAGSLLGVGGGVVMIPALILIFAYPVDKVAATSSSIIIFIGLAGMAAYMWHGIDALDLPGWSTGYVWWSAAIPLAIGGVPMARVGAMLNARTHDKLLQRIFGAAMFIISMRIFLS